MEKTAPYWISLLVLSLIACEPSLNGRELIEKSIQYHDPEGNWDSLQKTFYFSGSRPGNASRNYEIRLDNPNSYFRYVNNEEELIYEVEDQLCLSGEAGSTACQRALMLRDYYVYLWGLPMKLMDKETQIVSEYKMETIDGIEVYVVKVPYEEDVWYFYLHADTFQMLAYKFYTDETKEVGEFIRLKEEIIVQNIRIPAERSWYRTENGEFLGADYLLNTSDF